MSSYPHAVDHALKLLGPELAGTARDFLQRFGMSSAFGEALMRLGRAASEKSRHAAMSHAVDLLCMADTGYMPPPKPQRWKPMPVASPVPAVKPFRLPWEVPPPPTFPAAVPDRRMIDAARIAEARHRTVHAHKANVSKANAKCADAERNVLFAVSALIAATDRQHSDAANGFAYTQSATAQYQRLRNAELSRAGAAAALRLARSDLEVAIKDANETDGRLTALLLPQPSAPAPPISSGFTPNPQPPALFNVSGFGFGPPR